MQRLEYTIIQIIDSVFYGLTDVISTRYFLHKLPMLKKTEVVSYTPKITVSGLKVEKPEFYIFACTSLLYIKNPQC